MLNKEDIKIKYIIGSFREEPDYPTIEDFRFLILNWFFNEGGKDFIHGYRAVEETGNPCFTDVVLREKLNEDEKKTKELIERLLNEEIIRVHKQTKFTVYYEIIK
jgi:hypothetical protein